MAIIGFDDALRATEKTQRALLVGNGFSIRHFNYKNLLEKSGLDANDRVRTLFNVLETVDFEAVIKLLEDAATVERAYNKEKRATLFSSEADKLRRVLVHAIRQSHPTHRADIQDVIPPCIKFLSAFATIFTVNYDLLLYWVILDDSENFADGFGLGEESNGFRGPFRTEAHCNIYNLHGGLHLFRTSDDEVEKRLMGDAGVIEAIGQTITRDKRLPLYVSEGTSIGKLARIYSMPYLRHCYETLRRSSGVFFVYGHSASAVDAHIYDALFKSDIQHLYFCIHQKTAKLAEVDGELARYKKRNSSKIEYTFVDSETAKVWG